jgi:hypothetical protein
MLQTVFMELSELIFMLYDALVQGTPVSKAHPLFGPHFFLTRPYHGQGGYNKVKACYFDFCMFISHIMFSNKDMHTQAHMSCLNNVDPFKTSEPNATKHHLNANPPFFFPTDFNPSGVL